MVRQNRHERYRMMRKFNITLFKDQSSYQNLTKLNEILRHLKALHNFLHMAPIWYFYLYLVGNAISLNENITIFAFEVLLKKKQLET